MQSDKELYEEFLVGNKVAFDELIERYRKSVTNFIFSYVKNFKK